MNVISKQWFLASAISLVLFSGMAAADTVLTFTGTGAQALGGAYVAPYYGVLSSSPLNPNPPAAGTPKITIICDDWKDDVFLQNPNEYWKVTITNLGAGDVSGTMFSNLGSYEKAAYLVYEMGLAGNAGQVGDIQYALWDLLNPAFLPTGFSSTQSTTLPWGGTIGAMDGTRINAWLANAANEASSSFKDLPIDYFNEVEILTPVTGSQVPLSDGQPQEYITVVPEPSTVALIVTGIGGIASRRKYIFRL